MSRHVMTPNEVLEYGQRLILFPEQTVGNKREFFVKDGRIYQEFTLFSGDDKFTMNANPVEIFDIYHLIERVYSRWTKGILLAQRQDHSSKENRSFLPLVKTGKGLPKKTDLPEKRIEVAIQYLDYLDRKRHKQLG